MNPLFSIGHSNHSFEHFSGLLMQHEIALLADVRSSPYSRFNPQFNRPTLDRELGRLGVQYAFLGNELGARREEEACYVEGQVSFPLVWETPLFGAGIKRLLDESGRYRVAMMCAEKDPLHCHRSMMIARYLRGATVELQHIQADGQLESQGDLEDRLLANCDLPREDLFRSRVDLLEEAYTIQARRVAYSREE